MYSRSPDPPPEARAALPPSLPDRSRLRGARRSSTPSPRFPSPNSRFPVFLVCGDAVFQEQGRPDLVEASSQPVPAVAVHPKGGAEAGPVIHALVLEIDRQQVGPAPRVTTAAQLGDLLG